MSRRAGQATTEWIAVVAIVAALAAGAIAVLQRGLGDAHPRLAAALQDVAGGSLSVTPSPQLPGLGATPLAPVDGTSIVAIAEQLADQGIVEAPPGSNRGAAVDAFTGGRAEPWCADFVSWVLRSAGHPFAQGEGGWRLAWTGDIRLWFERRGRFRPRLLADPQPGDIIWFVHGHVGIVTRIRGSALETVEGNADDAVRRRTYERWRIVGDIGGFGRVPIL